MFHPRFEFQTFNNNNKVINKLNSQVFNDFPSILYKTALYLCFKFFAVTDERFLAIFGYLCIGLLRAPFVILPLCDRSLN